MPISILDIALSLFVYAILIFFMKWRFSYFKKRKQDGSDDNDGGIAVDYPTDPVLDLPPGVILPSDGPVAKREPEMCL